MPCELCVVALLPVPLDLGDRVSLPLSSLSSFFREQSRSHPRWLVQDIYEPTTGLITARTAAAVIHLTGHSEHPRASAVSESSTALLSCQFTATRLRCCQGLQADNTETRWSFRKIQICARCWLLRLQLQCVRLETQACRALSLQGCTRLGYRCCATPNLRHSRGNDKGHVTRVKGLLERLEPCQASCPLSQNPQDFRSRDADRTERRLH